MRKKAFNTINIVLSAILILVEAWKSGNIIAGIGAAIFGFLIGMALVGVVITGLFMFFYNIFKPDNRIQMGLTERITVGLIGAILYTQILVK